MDRWCLNLIRCLFSVDFHNETPTPAFLTGMGVFLIKERILWSFTLVVVNGLRHLLAFQNCSFFRSFLGTFIYSTILLIWPFIIFLCLRWLFKPNSGRPLHEQLFGLHLESFSEQIPNANSTLWINIR